MAPIYQLELLLYDCVSQGLIDWLKSILKAVKIFPSRPASTPVMICGEKRPN